MNILIASNNKHKVKEIKEIVYKNVGNTINFITAKELNININPEETGSTLAENAKIKAIAFYNASKIPVIADDSGLEVEILNGLPGIHSARFADINNDKANREKLLSLLHISLFFCSMSSPLLLLFFCFLKTDLIDLGTQSCFLNSSFTAPIILILAYVSNFTPLL